MLICRPVLLICRSSEVVGERCFCVGGNCVAGGAVVVVVDVGGAAAVAGAPVGGVVCVRSY